MDKTELQIERINDKILNEYNSFIEHLKTLPVDQIIESSYEKVYKEDLLIAFRDRKLSYQEAKAMLETAYPLDKLYQEWMKTDVTHTEILNDIIDSCLEKSVKEMKHNARSR